MSSELALRVDGLWKQYRLGEYGARTLYEDVGRRWDKLRRRAPAPRFDAVGNELGPISDRHFWALSDVSFSVERGDIVGLIGANGSGKSTLLKVLSRVTTPTRGRVRGRGRVSSLLEVGTGFHPELTGRENIYLNGSIMGMRRREIDKKVDEIVEFSGCGRHIETPVKRYSSGMVVRLGFAVAAHLDCEIMIVDEVLAVGDRAFQTRAVDKMKSVAYDSGRTILFVSHNLSTVKDFCHSGLLLDGGRLTHYQSIDSALTNYVHVDRESATTRSFPAQPDRPSITKISLDPNVLLDGRLEIAIEFSSPRKISPTPGIVISAEDMSPVLGTNTRMHRPSVGFEPISEGRLLCTFGALPIHEGRYFVSAWLGDGDVDVDSVAFAVDFEYAPPQRYPSKPAISDIGPVNVKGAWSLATGSTPASHSSGDLLTSEVQNDRG